MSAIEIDTPAPLALNELIPNAQLKIYPNAPHGLFYTHRDELNRDIAAFASDGRIALASAA